MSLTLGEKLRQAREDKGMSVGEVADATRIAPLYIESIDNDDYRALPGGIFNRGFVKSYAKYVGIDEQEALADYARLLNDTAGTDVEEVTTYRPQVLTDDRATTSMVPTIIVSIVILGLMTGGVLFLVNYLQRPSDLPVQDKAVNTTANTVNANATTETEASAEPTVSTAPDMAHLRIEFKTTTQPVSLTVTNDGKTSTNVITPGSTTVFEPKETAKFSYARSLAQYVQMTINGRTITLPATPQNPKRPNIEIEINKENLAQIWSTGAIPTETPVAAANATTVPVTPLPAAANPARTAAPLKTPAPQGTVPKPAIENKAVNTPRTVIVVGKPTPSKTR